MTVQLSLPFLLVFCFLVVFDTGGVWLAMLAAVAVHELGHVIALRCSGTRIDSLRCGLLGLELVCGEACRIRGYAADFLIALAGPLGSAAAAAASVLAWQLWRPLDWLLWFACLNLMLCAFNLLPAQPLDGGRMLAALLSIRLPPDVRLYRVRACSLVCGAAMLGFGGWAVYRWGANLSLPLGGAAVLLWNLRKNALQIAD